MPALNARSLKCTVVLDPADVVAIPVKDGLPRVLLRIRLPDRTVTANLAAKSVRRAQAAVREHGVDGVAAMIQGKLVAGDVMQEAGLAVQPKIPKPAQEAA
jgi:hypothetical protein